MQNTVRISTENSRNGYVTQTVNPTPLHLSSLEQTTLTAIEQGVWTAVSYFADIDPDKAMAVLQVFSPSIASLHEFDKERFEGICFDLTSFSETHCEKSIFSAKGLFEGYMNFNKTKPFSIKTIDEQADELHKVGIIVGASIAQEEIAKHCKQSAVEISSITLAPIGFNGFGE